MFLWSDSLHSEIKNWNYGRGYEPFKYATEEGLVIENQSDTLEWDYFHFDNPVKEFTLKFRAANLNGHPARKYKYRKDNRTMNVSRPHWGFIVTTLTDTIVTSIKTGEKPTMLESDACLDINIYNLTTQKEKSLKIKGLFNPYDGDNLWRLKGVGKSFEISGGEKDIVIIDTESFDDEITGFGFYAGWGGNLHVSDIEVEFKENEILKEKYFSQEYISDRLSNSRDSMEGYWTLFDRELEESLLKLGGNYNLACIKERGKYYMVYLDGCIVNASQWHPGDVKIVLEPTPFEGIFNVEWIDSMKESLIKDLKAQEGEGETLQIQFPYHSSKIRLRKLPSATSATSAG